MIIKTVIHTAAAVVTAEIIHKFMQECGWELLKKGYDVAKKRNNQEVEYVVE